MNWKSENWYVSLHNFAPEVTKSWSLPKSVMISDCTIRDGQSQPGIVLELDEKIKVARKLDELGIPDIEIASADPENDEEVAALRAIPKLKLKAKTSCITLSRKAVELAVDASVWGIRIPLNISEELRRSLGQSGMEDIRDIRASMDWMDYARSHGIYIIASLTDSTRAPMETLEKVFPILVNEAKVDRIRLADTVGAISPFGMAYLVSQVRRLGNETPIEVHPHGIFGLATANAVAAVSAGASAVSSSFNGLSTRGGNASTEEVIVSLKLLMGVDLDYIEYGKLYETSKLIQELTGEYVAHEKAVVGEELFAHENLTGHSAGNYFEFPFAGGAYRPEFVGQKRKLVMSKRSNIAAVKAKLSQIGIKANEKQEVDIMKACVKFSHEHKRVLTDNEVRKIARNAIRKK